jgi:hypothetical protein
MEIRKPHPGQPSGNVNASSSNRGQTLRIALVCLCAAVTLNGTAQPELSASKTVNAADYHAGALAPSEIVVLYPSNAGPPNIVTWVLDPTHAQQPPDFW